MNEKTEMDFVTELMKHIMEGVNIPKVQIERVVGPILGMFIKEVLPNINDSGDEVSVYPEFPFKKANNNQSTNIDWLMYNKTKNELIFFRVKNDRHFL